ncbi:NRDC protein, partial [Acromyrmex insinuator]
MQKSGNNENCQVEYLETPVKSENDKKEYRAIRLPNGLEALLISNDDSKISSSQHQDMKNEMKAACCLSVKTGFFKEPPEFPGISFFFEHILLAEFKKHCQKHNLIELDKHGGSCNYFLHYIEYTSFFFDIQKEHFLSVLIHFAEFFTNPLPEKDAFMQNRNDLKKEFQTALNLAKNRVPQPQLSSFTRTDHPINKITEDRIIKVHENLDYTKLYEELHKFKERHYSARIIKLVIQASLPLNTLEQYVTTDTCFVNIPTLDDSTELIKNDIPFDTAAFQKMYKISALKHEEQLEITWAMPSQLALYKSKPYRYIAWRIGNEEIGSLIHHLREKLWNISNKKICYDIHTIAYSLVKISIGLSSKGKQHIKEILDTIFSYINWLKKEGPQKKIYDEFSQRSENNFRYLDEENPMDNVKDLCLNLHLYQSRDYITGSKIYFEYDPKAITNILNYLTPETANIMIFDNDFGNLTLDKLDSWSKTYTDIEVPHEWLEHWKSVKPLPDFHLQEANLYIEYSLELPAKVLKYPVKLYSSNIAELWYLPDSKFGLAKSYMYTHFISSLGLQSPENAALMTMYCNILKLQAVEELHPAVKSGLYTYDISLSEKGIITKISGPMPIVSIYSKQSYIVSMYIIFTLFILQLLLSIIIKYMKHLDVTKEMFEIIRDQQINLYHDTFTKPGKLAEDMKLCILKLVHYTYVDMHNALQNCLMQGNVTQDSAFLSIQECIGILKCDSLYSSTMQSNRVFQLLLGTSYYKLKNINKRDPTSVVVNTYQIDVTSIELSVLIRLMIMIMKKQLSMQCELKNQDNLIQDISCDCTDVDGILEYSISTTYSVENKLYTTEDIEKWMNEFLVFFREFLNKFSENDLDDVKERFRIFKQHADMNVREEINRNWDEIMKCEYMFDRHEREILALNKIKINELREWFDKYTRDENYMRQLSVHIVGSKSDKMPSIALEYIIDEHQHNDEEKYITKHTALCSINFKEFKDFAKFFTQYLYIQCLIEGNMTENDAIRNTEQFLKKMKCYPLTNNTLLQMKVIQIPLGTRYCKLKMVNKSNSKSVVINYYQADVTSIKLSVLIELIVYIIEDSIYELADLEFEYVLCDIKNINGILGYFITICAEADKYTTEYMDQSIEKYLTLFKEILKDISEEEFNNYKESIKQSWHIHDVYKKVARNWNEITKFEYMFNRFQKRKLALKNIKIDEIRKWFEEHTLNGKNFRKLSIQIAGTPKKEVNEASYSAKKLQYFALNYIINDQQYQTVVDYKKKLYIYPVSEGSYHII